MYIDGSEFIWRNCTDDCISDRTKVIQVLILDQFEYAYKERVGECCSVSDFCDFKAQYTVFSQRSANKSSYIISEIILVFLKDDWQSHELWNWRIPYIMQFSATRAIWR